MLNYLSSLCSKSFCGFSTQLGRVFSLSNLEPGAKMEGRKILEMNRKTHENACYTGRFLGSSVCVLDKITLKSEVRKGKV